MPIPDHVFTTYLERITTAIERGAAAAERTAEATEELARLAKADPLRDPLRMLDRMIEETAPETEPERIPCPICGGTGGEGDDRSGWQCTECDGSGEVPNVPVYRTLEARIEAERAAAPEATEGPREPTREELRSMVRNPADPDDDDYELPAEDWRRR